MSKEKEIQEKYMQFQYLQQQLEQISQHLEMLNQQNAELDISINAVTELGKTKIDNELLAPIADGIFLKGELKDNKKLIINVGMNITVERTVPEVVKLLENQKSQLQLRLIEVEAVRQELANQTMMIYKEIEGKV
ncbi:MAG TPA: prefoldin subunit alpha [Candidatus Nanoarchaeia archaeon]|nr:prefoldin subunit alpha [Candidatus Nanoarchaeia archaeon]